MDITYKSLSIHQVKEIVDRVEKLQAHLAEEVDKYQAVVEAINLVGTTIDEAGDPSDIKFVGTLVDHERTYQNALDDIQGQQEGIRLTLSIISEVLTRQES